MFKLSALILLLAVAVGCANTQEMVGGSSKDPEVVVGCTDVEKSWEHFAGFLVETYPGVEIILLNDEETNEFWGIYNARPPRTYLFSYQVAIVSIPSSKKSIIVRITEKGCVSDYGFESRSGLYKILDEMDIKHKVHYSGVSV